MLENLSFDASYLLWWFKAGPAAIPVATTGLAAAFLNLEIPGTLGIPGTSIVLGNQPLTTPMHQGGRFTMGYGLDSSTLRRVEGGYFFLNKQTHSDTVALPYNSAQSYNDLVLSIPFYDVVKKKEGANVIGAIQGPGSATLTNNSSMQGAEVNYIQQIISAKNKQLSLLGGVYFLQLKEGLTFAAQQAVISAVFFDDFSGSFGTSVDKFLTQNNFYGAQLGSKFNYTRGHFFLDTKFKLALGGIEQKLSIQGSTTTNTEVIQVGFENVGIPIPTTTVPGGLFAVSSNIGNYTQRRFALIPDLTLGGGVFLSKNTSAFVNYNFLYVSKVIRPGNQMDRNSNNSNKQLYGISPPIGPNSPIGPSSPVAPIPLFNSSTFWAQGIQVGLRYEMT